MNTAQLAGSESRAPGPVERRLYRINEIAAMIGVSPDTVRRMAKRGQLTLYKRGSQGLCARVEDLEAYLNSLQLAPESIEARKVTGQ